MPGRPPPGVACGGLANTETPGTKWGAPYFTCGVSRAAIGWRERALSGIVVEVGEKMTGRTGVRQVGRKMHGHPPLGVRAVGVGCGEGGSLSKSVKLPICLANFGNFAGIPEKRGTPR